MPYAPSLLVVTEENATQRLDNFLVTRLKGVPKSCIYRLLRQGKIRLNRKRCKPDDRLQVNDSIRLPQMTVAETNSIIKSPSKTLQRELEEAVIFENEAFMILNKPYGLAVHGGSGVSLGLIESLRHIHPSERALELVHRLDRETSGCIIISKKPSALKLLHALFRNQRITKTYLTLTQGQWPMSCTEINQPLQKNQVQSGERVVKISHQGQPSYTRFKCLKSSKEKSLVQATPMTGRTHQIRVHARYAGHPIAGDEKYGSRVFNQAIRRQGLNRLFLHAYKLAFTCPMTHKPIRVTAPLPHALEKFIP